MTKEKYLKAKDLITILQQYEDNTIVFISKDEEGNELKPLPATEFYSDEKPWNHDMKDLFLDDFEQDEEVIVLWPIR